MLKKQAIILCAFANDLHRPLQLEAEEKTIAQQFAAAEDVGKVSFRPLHGAQLKGMSAPLPLLRFLLARKRRHFS